MSIGLKIKKLREKEGITQRELAAKIHFSNSYIGDIESNRSVPSIDMLLSAAKYFDVDISYFFNIPCCYQKWLIGKELYCLNESEECETCPFKLPKA